MSFFTTKITKIPTVQMANIGNRASTNNKKRLQVNHLYGQPAVHLNISLLNNLQSN